MKEAACRPELFTTAIVEVGDGIGRLEGRSSILYEGAWTKNWQGASKEAQGACLSFLGGSCSWVWTLGLGFAGLMASPALGVADGMESVNCAMSSFSPPFLPRQLRDLYARSTPPCTIYVGAEGAVVFPCSDKAEMSPLVRLLIGSA